MPKGLSVNGLRRFKRLITNENVLIAHAIKALLPPGDGMIIDVGAGLGDIASNAFPTRSAILIDLLDFDDSISPNHERRIADFLTSNVVYEGKISTLIFSHVLQYLDDDVEELLHRVDAYKPDSVITVLNDEIPLFVDILEWFRANDIPHNPEKPLVEFPGPRYNLSETRKIQCRIDCSDFPELATQLGRVVYDAIMTEREVDHLASWLGSKLTVPNIEIPESVKLYLRNTDA